MKDATWFAFVVRGVGVLLFGLGLPALLGQVVSTAQWLHGLAGPSEWGWFGSFATFGHLLADGSQVALGLYLAVDGKAVVAWVLGEVGNAE